MVINNYTSSFPLHNFLSLLPDLFIYFFPQTYQVLEEDKTKLCVSIFEHDSHVSVVLCNLQEDIIVS